jgi:hypothetical protein
MEKEQAATSFGGPGLATGLTGLMQLNGKELGPALTLYGGAHADVKTGQNKEVIQNQQSLWKLAANLIQATQPASVTRVATVTPEV